MSRWKNKVGKSQRVSEGITVQQYAVGWDLVSTGHTIAQILTTTGLTRPQLTWLMKVGDESRGMMGYQKRLAEQVARIRSRGQEAADAIGAGAVDAVKRATEINTLAQATAKNILSAHIKYKVQPVLHAAQNGEVSTEDLPGLAMTHGVRETLKVLKSYADFSETARAFRVVFDSPHQNRDALTQLPKEAKLDLSGEALLPATTALVEELSGDADMGHDLLDDLLPEFKGWNEEEMETFLETGERPASDYESGSPSLPAVIDSTATESE